MSEFTNREIDGFVRAANLDLGAQKYKASDLVADYAKSLTIIKQLMNCPKRKAAPDMYEALKELIQGIGWKGTGEKDRDIYYCEFCETSHEDCFLIQHTKECKITKIKQLLAKAEGKE